MVTYWKELGESLEKSRVILVGVICSAQLALILVFKLYFFSKV